MTGLPSALVVASRIMVTVSAAAALAQGPSADILWVEGESARGAEVVRHPWYRDVKADLLSGGDWLAHFGPREGTARFEVQAPRAGRYTLWVRANPVQAALSFRLGEGPWKEIDTRQARDRVNIARDDKPDLRFVAWIEVGEVELREGTNALAFKMHSRNNHHGGLDCFVLARGPFRPQGASRPGVKLGRAAPGTWAFEPDPDAFDPKALLDLRSLNEETAGRSGWVRRTPGGDFALGDGKPVRFWAANTTVQESSDPLDLAYHARFLAKRGVNMVRFHGAIQPKGSDSTIDAVDLEEIDRCHRLVAAMKKEGIYTTVSPYWAISARANPRWGLKGHLSGNLPGLLFWDEYLERAYRGWVRELLTRPNPHAGGLPLGKDPAMAIFQIQNEDSLLFWTLQSVKGEELDRLCKHHGNWLRRKYGSLEKARQAWGGHSVEGDDPAKGAMGLLGLWEYRPDVRGGKRARLADQVQYLAETMHAFNARTVKFLREELRCPVLVNAGNWRTANENLLLDAERWSYTAADVLGVNRYVTGLHQNPSDRGRAGYLVQKGDLFTDASVLHQPWKLPTNLRQAAGFPFIISESAWVPPLSRQAEGPFLVAAYSSLTGADVFYWFTLGAPGWDERLEKWRAASPAVLGGWPAAALLFRKGYLRKGEPVVREKRRLEDIWNLDPAAINESASFDPNRDSGPQPAGEDAPAGGAGRARGAGGAVHPLAFLVGPVEVEYGTSSSRSEAADLTRFIDADAGTVSSNTGEIKLDYRRGVATLDAPRAQGACGFLARRGTLELSKLRIESANEYAAVLAVPLDDRDLGESSRVLVQVTTTSRPHGWKDVEASLEVEKRSLQGRRIEDTGSAPWNVVETRVKVALRNSRLGKATLLDTNGMAARTLPSTSREGVLSLDLPPETLYVLLE